MVKLWHIPIPETSNTVTLEEEYNQMPRLDFASIEDMNDYELIPPGTYVCEVVKVEKHVTRAGDEMWRITLRVISGNHEGGVVFDNLVFSIRAAKRVKHFCSALGIDVGSELDLLPDMIRHRRCIVRVVIEEYQDKDGLTMRRNKVPFAGYSPIQDIGGIH